MTTPSALNAALIKKLEMGTVSKTGIEFSWTPKSDKHRSRTERRNRSKVGRRKARKMLAKHFRDHIRGRLSEQSFARRILPSLAKVSEAIALQHLPPPRIPQT